MADFFIKQFGGRVYPARRLGGLGVGPLFLTAGQSVANMFRLGISGTPAATQKPLGHVNRARYVSVGAAAAQFIVTAGADLPDALGENLTLTVAAASGSLTVSQVGLDITVQPAAGGSTAAAVVAAINAFFTGTAAQFVSAALPPGSAGGTNITASQAKRNFVADQRTP